MSQASRPTRAARRDEGAASALRAREATAGSGVVLVAVVGSLKRSLSVAGLSRKRDPWDRG
ncbi:MAG TPA: hypothetical protein VGR35_12335 [Tepidisphaeraceae bacterium]|nr:hypothetical protein [Tepidisphaeraceae bacterium]